MCLYTQQRDVYISLVVRFTQEGMQDLSSVKNAMQQ